MLPKPLAALANALREAKEKAEVYVVGGALRDLLLGREPHDYDLATSLFPEEIMAVAMRKGWAYHPTGIAFGTIAVVVEGLPVEVTTLRREGLYLNGRRPSEVRLGGTLEEDLARRDFTINAMAMAWPEGTLHDPFGGRQDLQRRLIRAVGSPGERFSEDGLRLLRAVRLAAELEFRLEGETQVALATRAHMIRFVAAERIYPEMERLILSPGAAKGLTWLLQTGLLSLLIPEAVPLLTTPPDGIYHALNLWDHTMEVVRLTPARPEVRWAAFFHDIGKPYTRQVDGEGNAHFPNHDAVGAELVDRIAQRLRFPLAKAERIRTLVARHMFTFDMGPRGMRRLYAQLGEEGLRDLLDLKLADMVGTGGRFVADAYDAFTEFRKRLDDTLAQSTAFTVRDLNVNGHDVMAVLGIPPGPRVGEVLELLLNEVLEDPSLNQRPYLLRRLQELASDAKEPPSGDPPPDPRSHKDPR